jgi:hypothetical protein
MVITPVGTGTQKVVTLKNVVMPSMPSLQFKSNETLIGSCSFLALGENNVDWSGANSLYQIADGAAAVFTAFDINDIVTRGYEVMWFDGDGTYTGFAPFQAQEGVQIDFDVATTPFSIDSVGQIDFRLNSVGARATAIPVGPTEAQLTQAQKLQGTGAYRGGAADSIVSDFAIRNSESEYVWFTLHNASLVDANIGYGQRGRHGPCVWEVNRQVSGGVLSPVFTIATPE